MKQINFLKGIIAHCIFFLLSCQCLSAQVSISGPTCVMTGTIYQYDIQGSWDASSNMKICIQGGTLVDSNIVDACTANGKPTPWIRVLWSTDSSGILSVSSSKGNATTHISATLALQPGTVDSTRKVQIIDSSTVPKTILCSTAAEGSCTPNYTYQWQQSSDALHWEDSPGNTQQNLMFSTPLTQTAFYRRKTTEVTSGTIGYSDVALIDLSNGAQ